MKLHPRRAEFLPYIFFLATLAAFAFGAYTISGPSLFDFPRGSREMNETGDTLAKVKPPSPDSAFNNLMQRADVLFTSNKFEDCLGELEKAQKLKPTDKTVNMRIVQLKGVIAEKKNKQPEFDKSLSAGDAAFQKKDYLNAKAYYQLALNTFPNDSSAKAKLRKTMDLLRSQKAQNTLYDVAVANADRLFQAGELDRASEEYQNASRLLPGEQYPKEKINEIIKLKVDRQLQEGEFAEAIRSADQYYNSKNWQPALLDYQKASKIKPQEKYPRDRIAELTPLIAAQRSRDEAYIKLIASADQLFSGKSYIASRKDYESASKIKPDQPYPKNKIAEIDGLLAKGAKTQKEFDEYISLADSFYIGKDFLRARDYYTYALDVKPGASYPKEMLEKVRPLVAGQAALMSEEARKKEMELQQAKQQALDKQRTDNEYAGLMASGEKLFRAKSLDLAKNEYQKALVLKPEEALPKRRISSIDSIGELLLKQKSLEEQYTGTIANADKLLAAKTYDQARSEYQKASALKPSEAYPKTKIQEIDKALAEVARLKKLDGDYLAAIKKGDSLLTLNQYAQAKAPFTLASALKPDEAYPKEKLTAINTALADLAKQQALDKQYLAAITAADKLMASKSWSGAKAQYTAALAIKPGEAYPGTKIAEIDKVLEKISKQKAVDDEYAGIMASGEKLFRAKSLDLAKTEFQKALVLKPEEALPKRRISSIDSIGELVLKQKSLEEQYTGTIANADKLLAAKTYDQARSEYQKASALKPSEAYPKTKIQEIDKALAEVARLKKLDGDYLAAIKKGDSLLTLNQYAQAKAPFTLASALKPDEAYPKEKLAAINTALADLAKQQALDKQYLAAVAAADKLLAAKSWSEAKAQYTAALAIKPGEAYPGTKIAEIDKVLEEIAKQKALDSEYAGLIASGEKLFASKSWEQAKPEYQKALALKPAEILPKKRITSIDSIAEVILKQKSLDDQYASTIANADKLLGSKTYDQARSEYQKASALKTSEAYPKTKILEIDKALAEIARLKKLDGDYLAAIKNGDSLLTLNQYAQAKAPFTQASALKPDEAYPKEKLSAINTALADLAKQQAIDKQYMDAVTTADKLLSSKSYAEAKTQYTAALAIKPGEAYPGTKIAEIIRILEEIARQKALDDQYSGMLAAGEKLFTAKSWVEAKAQYQKALTLKPAEILPKQRIASIDSINEAIQKQKALDAQYSGLIANADKLLSGKTLDQARSEYEKASAIKPSETYPKTKIAEIEKALADIGARKSRDSAYAVTVSNADKLLAAKSFEEAKAEYQKALQFKADDLYTRTKISEIDKTMADVSRQKAMVESNFKASVARADQLMAAKSYDQAKAEYSKALGIKAGEQYPQDRIKEIDNILAEMKARDDAFKASLAKADQMLFEKKYEDARTEYENALTIKPNEQYPKNKIDEINKKLTEVQGRKKTFDDLVVKGDNAFGSRDYGKAREYLQQAVALFPDDKYAKDRLGRVGIVIDSLYRANKGKYDKAIAEADKFYNGFEFDKAIDAYSDAAAFLPMENYPKEMIARIHKTISENAIADVLGSPVTINSNDEKKFSFMPLNIAARKDNFIYIKLRNLSAKPFSVLLRYGKDKTLTGGVVIRNLSIDGKVNERLISVREQDAWYRIDNDYISLYPQGGDIEVTFIQVSKAR